MRVTINIDGGSRGNPGPGASAYVIKDANGKILAQEGHFIAHCTNNQAEYTALKLALIKAAELGAKELDIISDSLLLVKQYLGEYKIKHPDLAARMAEIRALAAPFHIMDLKQSVGFNPIKNLNPASKTPDNIVNGVPVEPVKREPAPQAAKSKPAKNKKAVQPSLFDGF